MDETGLGFRLEDVCVNGQFDNIALHGRGSIGFSCEEIVLTDLTDMGKPVHCVSCHSLTGILDCIRGQQELNRMHPLLSLLLDCGCFLTAVSPFCHLELTGR